MTATAEEELLNAAEHYGKTMERFYDNEASHGDIDKAAHRLLDLAGVYGNEPEGIGPNTRAHAFPDPEAGVLVTYQGEYVLAMHHEDAERLGVELIRSAAVAADSEEKDCLEPRSETAAERAASEAALIYDEDDVVIGSGRSGMTPITAYLAAQEARVREYAPQYFHIGPREEA